MENSPKPADDTSAIVEKTARDYAEYFHFARSEVPEELRSVDRAVDEMLARLDEFETLIKVAREANEGCSSTYFVRVMECERAIGGVVERTARLRAFVDRVHDDLTALQRQVERAEAELGVPDNRLRTFLKPLLSKVGGGGPPPSRTEGIDSGEGPFAYSPPDTFRTDDYFRS